MIKKVNILFTFLDYMSFFGYEYIVGYQIMITFSFILYKNGILMYTVDEEEII